MEWRINRSIRVSIYHELYSCPHFENVSHSSVLGIERKLPIKGYFLGPGGKFRLFRAIQYTTKTVKVLRTKSSRVGVICGKR